VDKLAIENRIIKLRVVVLVMRVAVEAETKLGEK